MNKGNTGNNEILDIHLWDKKMDANLQENIKNLRLEFVLDLVKAGVSGKVLDKLSDSIDTLMLEMFNIGEIVGISDTREDEEEFYKRFELEYSGFVAPTLTVIK